MSFSAARRATPTPATDRARMVVAAGADEAFALGLAALGRSVHDHRPRGTEVDFYVFDAGLEPETRARLDESWRLPGFATHWIRLDIDLLADRKLDRYRFPVSSCVPLLLERALPAEVDRVLYLDADVVVRADLMPLWRADLAGAPLAAVQDSMVPYLRNQFMPEGIDGAEQAGCFNAGVLVIDLAHWRRESVGARAIDHAEANLGSFWSQDQQGLACVVVDDWARLPLAWNRMSHLRWIPSHRDTAFTRSEFEEARSEPRIMHFAGGRKPWHENYDGDFAGEFFTYLDRTAWAGWRPPVPTGRRRLAHALGEGPYERLLFIRRGLRLAAQEGYPRWPWIRSAVALLARAPWTVLTAPTRWLVRRRATRGHPD